MEASNIDALMQLGVERLCERCVDESERQRVVAFIQGPFGATALARANALLWLALEVACFEEQVSVVDARGTTLRLPPEVCRNLKATLGRLLPDVRTEVATARAAGLFELAAQREVQTSEGPSLVAVCPQLCAWALEPQSSELLALLSSVTVWAACVELTRVAELTAHPALPARLEQALRDLGRALASLEALRELRCGVVEPEPSAPRLDEDVQFTVYKPRALAPLEWTPFLAFAHLGNNPPDAPPGAAPPQQRVQEQAEALLGARARQFEPRVEDAASSIPREGQLTFVPHFDGLDFSPPYITFVWLGEIQRAEFRMRAPSELAGKIVKGQLRVFCGGLILAELNLSIRISWAKTDAADQSVELSGTARPYRKIFASYSHDDSDIVEHVRGYAQAIGDRYLIDYISLRSGETWSPGLERLIREADVFQLFWSQRSMASTQVRREWEYALSLARPSFVRPTYWESPMPAAPEQLRALHFSCITLPPSPPALAADGGESNAATPARASALRAAAQLLGGLATGSAAVLLSVRSGGLDRRTSAAEQLSRAAAKVVPSPPRQRSDSIQAVELGTPRSSRDAVPEIHAGGVVPALMLVLGMLAVLRGRVRRRL
jgi:hypothetical protein